MPAAILLRLIDQVLGSNEPKHIQFTYGESIDTLALKIHFH